MRERESEREKERQKRKTRYRETGIEISVFMQIRKKCEDRVGKQG